MKGEIKRLGSSILTYGIGQVLSRTLMLLLLPVFTAYLTPAEYGVSAILALLTFIAVPLFSLGLGAGVGPCYFEGNDRTRKASTIYTATAILLVSATVLAGIGVFFGGAIAELAFDTPQYTELVRLTLLSAAFTVLTGPFMQYLQFEERAPLYIALTGSTTVLTVGLTVLFIVGLGRGLRGMIEANAVGQLVSLLMFSTAFVVRERAPLSARLAAELLRLGLVLLPGFAFQFLLQQGNKYILQEIRGLSTVGVYTIGWNVGMAMSMLVIAFGNAWYAYFMRFLDDRETARVLFARLVTTYVHVFGTIAVMFFIFARLVITILTQPAFGQAALIVGFSATAQFLNGLYLMLLPGVYFEKKLKYQTAVYAIAAALGLGLNVVLIARWGLIGAGVGLAAAQLVLVIVQYVCNRLVADLGIAYEWKRIAGFSALYVLTALAGLWPRTWPLGAELAAATAAAAIFVTVVAFSLGDDERGLIRDLFTRLRRAEAGATGGTSSDSSSAAS